MEQIKIELPFSDRDHYILVIEKIKQTPIKYPRRRENRANPLNSKKNIFCKRILPEKMYTRKD